MLDLLATHAVAFSFGMLFGAALLVKMKRRKGKSDAV
jgi:hypothetical protein